MHFAAARAWVLYTRVPLARRIDTTLPAPSPAPPPAPRVLCRGRVAFSEATAACVGGKPSQRCVRRRVWTGAGELVVPCLCPVTDRIGHCDTRRAAVSSCFHRRRAGTWTPQCASSPSRAGSPSRTTAFTSDRWGQQVSHGPCRMGGGERVGVVAVACAAELVRLGTRGAATRSVAFFNAGQE